MGGLGAVRQIAIARMLATGGGVATNTALSYGIYDRTRSTAWTAAYFLVAYAAYGLFQPAAGILADRYDRRWLMVGSDLGLAVLLVVQAFVTSPGGTVALALTMTVVAAAYGPASRAALPNLVSEAQLTAANAMMARYFSLCIVIGPAVGGGLYKELGVRGIVLIAAVGCVASAVLCATVRGEFQEARGDDQHEHGGVMAGVRFLLHHRVLRALVIAEVIAFSGGGLGIVADAPLARMFDAGPFGYGELIASWGLGMLLASAVAGRLKEQRFEFGLVVLGMAVEGLFTLLVWPSPTFALALVCLFGGGAGMGTIETVRQSVLQRRAPDAVRGRVFAAADAVGGVSFAGSFVIAAPIVAIVGAPAGYGIAGLTFLAGVAVVAWLVGRDVLVGRA